MKNNILSTIAFGLFFLFMIQLAGILIESIYILDLMNTSLDAKVLGVLFFFTPVLLLPFSKKLPNQIIWLFFGLLFVSRGIMPYLDTLGRMLASGIGIGSILLLFPFLATATPGKESRHMPGLSGSAGLALAVALSVLLRTVNHSLDLSLAPEGGWIGWGLGLLFGWTLTRLTPNDAPVTHRSNGKIVYAVSGIFLVFTLAYFAFSAPAVIARWTQGNYGLIVLAVSMLAAIWVFVAMSKPTLLNRITRPALLIWNLLFALSLTGTILAHRISFPSTPDSPAVVVGAPTFLQQVPLVLMLFSFPVIFLDLRIFFNMLQEENSSPRALISGTLIGSTILVLLVFIHIFTNVWGYVAPVSTIFRNQFYLPYLSITGALTILIWRQKPSEPMTVQGQGGRASLGWTILLGAVFLGTAISAMRTERVQPGAADKTSLIVMTYNIQQANDDLGEKSYNQQLALIQKVSPDILVLQESDSTRISLNNNDYVRYYADKLGYYSYYGPTTVTGTFGTAILSKYPLQNTRSVFTFSDTDEIGTAEAEITVGGRVFTIYNVHPDGSDTAMLVFARSVIERSSGKANVIILGDYNLRDYEEAFHLIEAAYINAWTSVYPSKIGADGIDMSGKYRIDHIFFSPDLFARNPIYILPPASATDHPVHWTKIYWGQ